MLAPGRLHFMPVSFKLVFYFTMFFSFTIAGSLVAGFIIQLIYGINPFLEATALKDFNNPQSRNLVRWMQLALATSGFIVGSLAGVFFLNKRPCAFLKLNTGIMPVMITAAILCSFMVVPLVNYLLFLNQQLNLPESLRALENFIRHSEDEVAAITHAFLSDTSVAGLVINLVTVALIPAIGEELFFRGCIQQSLNTIFRKRFISIFITAFIFSAIHMQFYGFLPRLLLGLMLGWLMEYGRSIWVPIIAHFVNNASAVLIAFFLFKKDKSGNSSSIFDTVGTQPGDLIWVIASAVTTVAVLYAMYDFAKKNKTLFSESAEVDSQTFL
ncbi:MAG: CPBP family intramembrane metalloprotease [Bacteroidetes bacterium]|nr:CPBP family intramembrane metalloprotease [Bacteroidota bacterium]